MLSPQTYNWKVGLAIVCPITSKIKGYPFEVPLPEDLVIAGVVLTDQIKSMDWRIRQITFIDRAPASVITEVAAKVRVLLPSSIPSELIRLPDSDPVADRAKWHPPPDTHPSFPDHHALVKYRLHPRSPHNKQRLYPTRVPAG